MLIRYVKGPRRGLVADMDSSLGYQRVESGEAEFVKPDEPKAVSPPQNKADGPSENKGKKGKK